MADRERAFQLLILVKAVSGIAASRKIMMETGHARSFYDVQAKYFKPMIEVAETYLTTRGVPIPERK